MDVEDEVAWQEAISLVKCPVDWVAETDFGDEEHGSVGRLEFEWARAVDAVAVTGIESQLAMDYYLYRTFLMEPDWDGALINLRERRPEAVRLYMEGIGRMAGLIFLSPSYNGKHFVPNVEPTAVVERSKNGPSLFFKDYDPQALKSSFWIWFESVFDVDEDRRYEKDDQLTFRSAEHFPLWSDFLAKHQVRIAFDTMLPIGAVKGEIVQHVAMDIAIDMRTGHSYPVTEAEAAVIMKGLWSQPVKLS
ncbi:hypothetical protein [Mesorhizobium neociceri]|uniref:Uncharacterized protein n=1 Tax=Mesorhizobium neociceri TaxID=1307853 RepID=A0A838BCN9_9HYPH|nr:hypothetical protein [Mesorhizobium neociceri]MBA1143090.1 hypothetical protein [Mesorhizobium neociceri]